MSILGLEGVDYTNINHPNNAELVGALNTTCSLYRATELISNMTDHPIRSVVALINSATLNDSIDWLNEAANGTNTVSVDSLDTLCSGWTNVVKFNSTVQHLEALITDGSVPNAVAWLNGRLPSITC